MITQRYHIPLIGVACALIGLATHAVQGFVGFKEGALIENMTVVFYAAPILSLAIANISPLSARLAMMFFVAILAGRELDLNKAFTTGSITKANYYLKSNVSLAELSLSILFLVSVAGIIIWLIAAKRRQFAADLKARKAYAWSVVVGGALIAMSKSIDGIGRKLKGWFGLNLDASTSNVFVIVEETMEMMIPLAILVACIQFMQMTRSQSETGK